ncbi:MAG: cytochrome c biogenesis protein CcdA [Ruminococcaceae bacterium]|nr:cytochrome c biogenesis protein CcdA [Oscillospiraceae bacterium]
MSYLIAFLEGIITFISPCLLPMLPIYLAYFTGGDAQGKKTLRNAFGFILGFTVLFVLLGAFAVGIGGLIKRYQTIVNIVTGLIVLLFGLNFTGVLPINLLSGIHGIQSGVRPNTFLSSVVFGVIFAVGWTPCVGTFLGSALLLAAQQDSLLQGILMLAVYSLGLGIPFLISALLIDRLKSTFDWIKQHYRVINIICGFFLIAVGILMMTGRVNAILSLFSA